jgi:hypothetical protein
MIHELLFITSVYYFLNFSEYCLHKLSHSRKYGFIFYNKHKVHHINEFPITRLTCDPKDFPITHVYKNIYLHVSIIWWIIMYQLLISYYFNILLIESIIYMLIIDHIHDQYHTNHSYLERFVWFQNKKKKHLYHHKKTHRNFNIIDFTSDKMNQTYD